MDWGHMGINPCPHSCRSRPQAAITTRALIGTNQCGKRLDGWPLLVSLNIIQLKLGEELKESFGAVCGSGIFQIGFAIHVVFVGV